MLSETAVSEALEVVVKDSPQRSANGPIPGYLAEARSCAQDMPDAVHPRRFTALIMGVDNSDPVIDLLQSEPMVRRG